MKDIRVGHVFQIKEDWGNWLLWDDCLDTGDVSFRKACCMATTDEIKREKEKRKELRKVFV